MAAKIESLVRKWTQNGDKDLSRINRRLDHLERRLYKTYEPGLALRKSFWERLEAWLDGVDDEKEKQDLFRLAPELFFVGPEEFLELYRCAYAGQISRWLVEQANIDICAPDAQIKLRDAAAQTWFCPLSDSLRINSFYHVNFLAAGADHRPDWRSLAELGSKEKILKYCTDRKIQRIVILEDFVGGGSQADEALPFASTLSPNLATLFVPLIVCPTGAAHCRKLCELNAGLSFQPVIELPREAFFTKTNSPFQEELSDRLRSLLESTYPKVSGGVAPPGKPYGPFGFPPNDPVGGLVVMFSNTPDNTLPIIHWQPKNGAWHPLFPRHSRV